MVQYTLEANREGCVGMAANMIGVKKRVIIVNMGLVDLVMFNPVLLKADTPYEAEEGCLSLVGVRKTTRYQNIEVQYTKPMLTTVRLPKEEMGKFALYLLIDRLGGGHKGIVRTELEGKLMIRESCTLVENANRMEYYI